MHYDLAILDLDGVVYIGPDAVPHAIAALNDLAARGTRLTAATNNANRPAHDVASHLASLGLRIAPDDVMTSAQAAASFLARALPPDAPVLAVGGPGVAHSLQQAGLRPMRADADLAVSADVARSVRAVVTGYGPLTAWFDIACAHWAITAGARWIATNTDPSVPTPYGFAPGNGAFVGLLQRSTGVEPEVMGKPGQALFAETMRRAGTARALVIGDRLDTDIDGANAAHIDSLLVCTGVNDAADLAAQRPTAWPTFVARDLRALTGPSVSLRIEAGRAVAPDDDPVVVAVVAAANRALGHDVAVPHIGADGPAGPLVDCRAMRTATL